MLVLSRFETIMEILALTVQAMVVRAQQKLDHREPTKCHQVAKHVQSVLCRLGILKPLTILFTNFRDMEIRLFSHP